MNAPGTLVAGIGSPQGDDRAGWLVIDRLANKPPLAARLRKATSPHHLIDWMSGTTTLHIVDACVNIETIERIEIADPQNLNRIDSGLAEIDRLSGCHSTHHLDLRSVIELAHSLGKLPQCVVLWAVAGVNFAADQELSQRCERAIGQCVDGLLRELSGAV